MSTHAWRRKTKTATVACLAVLLTSGTQLAHADRGSTILKRLQKAGLVVTPLTPVGDYAPDTQPKPTEMYTIYATGKNTSSFQFVAMVFETPADAAAAFTAYRDHLKEIGTPGSYDLVRHGRVIYQGATGPVNPTSKPPPRLPTRTFQTLIKISEGRLY